MSINWKLERVTAMPLMKNTVLRIAVKNYFQFIKKYSINIQISEINISICLNCTTEFLISSAL